MCSPTSQYHSALLLPQVQPCHLTSFPTSCLFSTLISVLSFTVPLPSDILCWLHLIKFQTVFFFLRDVAINKNIQLYIQIHLHAYLCGGTGIEMTPQTNSLTLVIQTHIVTSWLHSFSPSYISSHNFPSNIFILLLFLQDATCTQLVMYPRKISRLHIVSFFKLIALHICVWWAIPSSSESMCSLCGHSLPQLLI